MESNTNYSKLRKTNSQELYVSEIQDKIDGVSQVILFNHLKTKLEEAEQTKNSSKARKIRRIYKKLQILRQICFLALIIIPFFENPIWCKPGQYQNRCRNPKGDQSVYIPTSNIPYLERNVFLVLQMILLIFLTFNKVVKSGFMVYNKNRQRLLWGLIIIVVLSCIDNIIQLINYNYSINITLFTCPIFFVIYHGKLRRVFVIYMKVIIKGFPILFTQIFNILLFSGLGRVIFYEVEEGNYFDDFWDGTFELLVLQTTSNFPDVMMPYYTKYSWAPIFFILFLLINYILLTNMLLGVFYMSYKSMLEEDTKTYFLQQEKIQEQINHLHETEQKLNETPNNTAKQSRQSYISNKSETEQINVEQSQDQQNFSEIIVEESSIPQRNTYSRESQNSRISFIDVQNMATKYFGITKQPCQTFENMEFPFNRKKNFVAKILQNIFFDITMGILTGVSFLLISIEQNNMKLDNNVAIIIMYINFGINFLFIIEMMGRIYVLGFKLFIKRKFFFFEGLVSLLLLGFMIPYFVTKKFLYVCQFFIILKVLRFLLITNRIKGIGQLYKSIIQFLPYFIDILSVQMIFFFIFSGIGQHLFGGDYNTSNQHLLSPTSYNNFYVPQYIYNNFNDQGSGFVLLFELLVVNNWAVNTEVACAIKGSKMYRLFFIIWYIFAVVLSFSILVAFIIDYLVTQWELWEKEYKLKKQAEEIQQQKELEEQLQLKRKYTAELKQQIEEQSKLEQQIQNQQHRIQQQLDEANIKIADQQKYTSESVLNAIQSTLINKNDEEEEEEEKNEQQQQTKSKSFQN